MWDFRCLEKNDGGFRQFKNLPNMDREKKCCIVSFVNCLLCYVAGASVAKLIAMLDAMVLASSLSHKLSVDVCG